jgi:hypothetical protein
MSNRMINPKRINAKIHGSQGCSSCARMINRQISAAVVTNAAPMCLTRPPPAAARRHDLAHGVLLHLPLRDPAAIEFVPQHLALPPHLLMPPVIEQLGPALVYRLNMLIAFGR